MTIPQVKIPEAPETSTVLPVLTPALFAGLSDLSVLRHDYPLVLLEGRPGAPLLRPLSRIIDDVLKAVAPKGASGEAMRQGVLRLEQNIRTRVFAGEEGRLSELWLTAEQALVEESGEEQFGPLYRMLDEARLRLQRDGRVLRCDGRTPFEVIRHAYEAMHQEKARVFRKKVDGLVLKLSEILKSDHMKSDEAHGPDALANAMGRDEDGSIDFTALSRILHRVHPEGRLTADRVARVRSVLTDLQNQKFYEGEGTAAFGYVFESCTEALDACRDRMADLVAFNKALMIAELEVSNHYVPSLHDPVFASFDQQDLTEDQINLMPAPLVLLGDQLAEARELASVMEAMSSRLPFKLLVQVDDILGDPVPVPPSTQFGAASGRLAVMAMALERAYVMQTANAHLYQMKDEIERGMAFAGPSLFCVYSGAGADMSEVSAYLASAAACEARAFVNFTYDPSMGDTWAKRFDLSFNRQVELSCPTHELAFEDGDGARRAVGFGFTFGDFILCDRRYRCYCKALPRAEWPLTMMPLDEYLQAGKRDVDILPYVLGVDGGGRLMRVVVEDRIVQETASCLRKWSLLQEQAGINNSHVVAALNEERRSVEAQRAEDANTEVVGPATAVAVSANENQAEPVPEADEADASGVADGAPWIETARCTTCNECRQINDKLFGYNDNMQAFVADPDAGTYRQLVEAAESCQVSIIHPGLPRNPDEEGLDELMERAEPFN